MTCVIDASCLIDLRKGGLLRVLGNLPYRLIIPLPIRASELLDFSDRQWQRLDAQGMITHDLTPTEVAQALMLKERYRALSANDCFCLVAALANRGILLTGDALLRKVAVSEGLRVHGVLWVIDELAVAEACSTCLLVDALRTWQSDSAVFLPQHEIASRLTSLARQP
ncbi:MAG: type II toxin-antitoxin system VapC family toxin [Caldilineaceae bacterium SB0665_bin_21]|nr:type II toxin-antitoxin system VapC family toxin [Caldilineaceae bacterium SB0665_bin_21]MYA06030.1 type II toxin-antitoxin system VapC family toxin [Caldilineaceae bacterium SB0664_bin_22]MYC61428.1 type II toxin-antitoxin system VapC family toxin [Caldilineaceae bacterium SB0661_bin_34]